MLFAGTKSVLNIFIIGKTKVGKTTLGKILADKFQYQSISASEWIKCRLETSNVEKITQASLALLKDDPDACVNYLQHKYHIKSGGLIIDGIRNPRDFLILFDPSRDIIISIENNNIDYASQFEEIGLKTIKENIKFLKEMNLFSNEIEINSQNIDDVIKFSETISLNNFVKTTTYHNSHFEIKPINAWVEEKVLYNEDPNITSWAPCKIFACSIYKDNTITFEILLDNGAVFSYVPPHRLSTINPNNNSIKLGLSDLVYCNVPNGYISIVSYDALKGKCWAYFKSIDQWLTAQYLTTIDWYTDNLLVHLISLENGQLACLPSHKILFSDTFGKLPNYKKLKIKWSL